MRCCNVSFLCRAGLAACCAMAVAGTLQAQHTAVISGSVEDAETGEPVRHAQVLAEDANRSSRTDRQGRFEMRFLEPGVYTLTAWRIGYESLTSQIAVGGASDTSRVVLRMSASPIELGEVFVDGQRESVALREADMDMEGKRLRQHLGTTIAETLDNEPGISMRSMGPAPARPVLRGLGGERLLVLEDGGRTGDLSATSADHAVAVDPLMTERIEVVRGPAALLYGPNALGGMINAVRGYVPATRPPETHATAVLQGQSANDGISGGFSVEAPAGAFAWRADGSMRNAGDVSTPVGVLANTDLRTGNGSFGASRIGSWGYAGASGSYYASRYGIPGGFVGAHPKGVDIELSRRYLKAKGMLLDAIPRFPHLEFEASLSRYFHQEYEASGTLGIEFGLLSYYGRILSRVHGRRSNSLTSIWAGHRDFASGGFTFTPNSREWTAAAFRYQDINLRNLSLQGALRYDIRAVRPRTSGRFAVGEVTRAGLIRNRTTGGVSGSLRVLRRFGDRFSAGLGGVRSIRMPGIEELFSTGPHLAAYAFEIGNADLGVEKGLGFEAFAEYRSARFSGSLNAYRNHIRDYIYPRNTGRLNVRTLLTEYQQTGSSARMTGSEASFSLRAAPSVTLSGSGAYVRGTLIDDDEPMSFIPPLRGRLEAAYARGKIRLSGSAEAARRQDRLGEFEEPTDGYVVFGAHAQYHLSLGRILYTFDIGVENATNAEYRDHLSKVKSIMPQQGRNVKILIKALW
ncbi:MAG: TonB-dependent receptor [Bacteroidetes bacterium SB0662_bin_6]|nr:TonB-dependent receptor [Bacteroidetes bacterium SB0668_bin_1]MYE04340.1 TonB-dependent receptor [Bacteroidetes bacterium SB0662_bin_6]